MKTVLGGRSLCTLKTGTFLMAVLFSAYTSMFCATSFASTTLFCSQNIMAYGVEHYTTGRFPSSVVRSRGMLHPRAGERRAGDKRGEENSAKRKYR
ncbi:hypothetical protein C8R43DRAFT_1039209 [Mycena crocata]|nr:hypothetical protein C8R43DRAFT_1039209 [Mycena crocata]